MKKIIFIFTILFTICSTNIYAARFGSGKSFGQHRSSQSYNRSKPADSHQQKSQNQQQSASQTPAKSSLASKILPALAGLSIGAMLGSLLGGHGLGGGLGAIFLLLGVVGIALFAFKKFMNSRKGVRSFNSFQNAGAQNFSDQSYNQQNHSAENYNKQNYNGQTYPGHTVSDNAYQSSSNDYASNNDYTSHHDHASFNKEEFLRTAKTIFIRMQNAYDSKNLDDIRSFTTPEVFAEIQMQIQEMGSTINKTEVVYIDASLTEEHLSDDSAASVFFSGQIREQQSHPSVEIRETWHFVKHDNKNWLISGLQQQNR